MLQTGPTPQTQAPPNTINRQDKLIPDTASQQVCERRRHSDVQGDVLALPPCGRRPCKARCPPRLLARLKQREKTPWGDDARTRAAGKVRSKGNCGQRKTQTCWARKSAPSKTCTAYINILIAARPRQETLVGATRLPQQPPTPLCQCQQHRLACSIAEARRGFGRNKLSG